MENRKQIKQQRDAHMRVMKRHGNDHRHIAPRLPFFQRGHATSVRPRLISLLRHGQHS